MELVPGFCGWQRIRSGRWATGPGALRWRGGTRGPVQCELADRVVQRGIYRRKNRFPRRKAGLSHPRGSGPTLLPQASQTPTDYTRGLPSDRYFSLNNFHVSSLIRTKAPAQDESETYPASLLQVAEGLISFAFYRSKSSNIVYIPVRKTKVSSHR